MTATSLYQRAMGDSFYELPELLQRFHMLRGECRLTGTVEITPPETTLARLLARCLGTPLKRQFGSMEFELSAQPEAETWVRRFPGKTMKSRLSLSNGQLAERLGLAKVVFDLRASPDKLEMRLASLRFLGIFCPAWLRPAIVAEETVNGGQLHFLVQASLPLIGLVTRYEGNLNLPEGAQG